MGSQYLANSYVIFACYFSLFCVCQARDTLGVNETIVVYYGDFLESSNQRFQLTISHGVSWAWNLAIVYSSMRQSIEAWSNNYLEPSRTEPAFITMNSDGRLVVYDISHKQLILVNSQQRLFISNTTATILDNGNLILRAPAGNVVWQSFDYPTNKWLQGVKLGIFGSSSRVLTSKPTFEDPTSILGINPNNTKEIVIAQDGVVYWRSGVWNGQNFPFLYVSADFGLNFYHVSNPNESYFTWNSSRDPFALFLLASSGSQINIRSGDFIENQRLAVCDMKGDNGTTSGHQTMGCTNPCGANDGFKEILGDLDLWDEVSYNNAALHYCKSTCRKNCSCYAYSGTSYDDTGVALGCKLALRNKGKLISEENHRLFIRESFVLEKADTGVVTPPTQSPELAPIVPWRKQKSDSWKMKLSFGAAASFVGALALVLYLCCNQKITKIRYRQAGPSNNTTTTPAPQNFQQLPDEINELPIFAFSVITLATDQFSDENKLGQGEFGQIYKGKLPTGQDIAVKRLNIMSWAGIEQFKNEVVVMSKLQHRNLEKLLGYCIHEEDRMLVYEYLPNGSLDSFIFDTTKQGVLDWERRLHIIEGIAQGLLYLHKYSRLRIIHRDLKTSNVLLDNDLNPKISCFGRAKIFGEEESRANTLNVKGTVGYMSPEYAMSGIISEKSDIYSYGVMMLEIITGKIFKVTDHLTLVEHIWDLWKEGKVSEIADHSLGETIPAEEISRYVQVGLLCVEENAEDRPTMFNVISMLNNELLVSLPVPNPRNGVSTVTSCPNDDNFVQHPESSNNLVAVSDLEAQS